MKKTLIVATALTGLFMIASRETPHDITEFYCEIDEENLSAKIRETPSDITLYSMIAGHPSNPDMFQGDAFPTTSNAFAGKEPLLIVFPKDKECVLGKTNETKQMYLDTRHIFKIK